jgi:translation initiation factor 2A
MASAGSNTDSIPLLAVRGPGAVQLVTSPAHQDEITKVKVFNVENCRLTCFSRTGHQFVIADKDNIQVYCCNTRQVLYELPKRRVNAIEYSPQDTYLLLFEPFTTVAGEEEKPNLFIYKSIDGELVGSYIQKKQSEWAPIWSNDEAVFGRMQTSQVWFYEVPNFERYVNRLSIDGLQIFSLGKSKAPYTIAAFIKGKKGMPDCVRLLAYPDLKATIASKSFFNFDHVNMKWNFKGTALLVLCSTDMSENSYYGDTMLQHLNRNGDSSNIQLSKAGPIYSMEWSPIADEFCVVYGFMPSKATIFNSKCDVSWELSSGAKNAAYYSFDGLHLALCGFGNVAGNIEVWNMKDRKRVSQIEALDTTHFQWCYDNFHFITATTAPRLRVKNGFKVWRLTGELVYEYKTNENQELWQVIWQPGMYVRGEKSSIKSEDGSAPGKPKATAAYRPPHLRQTTRQVPKLHEDVPVKPVSQQAPRVPKPGGVEELFTGDLEKDKKIKQIHKKLQQIKGLKERLANGDKLEVDQLEKIKRENELIEEMENLRL